MLFLPRIVKTVYCDCGGGVLEEVARTSETREYTPSVQELRDFARFVRGGEFISFYACNDCSDIYKQDVNCPEGIIGVILIDSSGKSEDVSKYKPDVHRYCGSLKLVDIIREVPLRVGYFKESRRRGRSGLRRIP